MNEARPGNEATYMCTRHLLVCHLTRLHELLVCFSVMMSWGKSRHNIHENMHVLYMKTYKHAVLFFRFSAYFPPHDIIVEKGLLQTCTMSVSETAFTFLACLSRCAVRSNTSSTRWPSCTCWRRRESARRPGGRWTRTSSAGPRWVRGGERSEGGGGEE